MATGDPPRLAVAIVPSVGALDANHGLVSAADETGLDLVRGSGHPYQREFLDTWSPIPTLPGETRRSCSPPTSHPNLPPRAPAVMAKPPRRWASCAARFELGLGPRAFPRRDRALRRSAAHMVEAVEVLEVTPVA